MRLRVEDNPKLVVRQDYAPVVYTGTTQYIFVASGNTELTQSGGNPDTVTIYSPTGGSATWGLISGTLSAQTDLQAELDAKLDISTYSGYTGTTQTTLTGLRSDVDTTSGLTVTNASGISQNASDIQLVSGVTSGQTTDITQNAADIQLVSGETTTNAAGIASNLGYIQTLTGETSVNAADIQLVSGETTTNANAILTKLNIADQYVTGTTASGGTVLDMTDGILTIYSPTGGTSATWGLITGTLADQTDLNTVLTGHTADIATNASDIQLVSGETTTNAANFANYLPLAGGTMTGAADLLSGTGININNGSASPSQYFFIDGHTGSTRGTFMRTNNYYRWGVFTNNVLEAVGDAGAVGSDFAITCYSGTSASVVHSPITISRATGVVTMPKGAVIEGVDIVPEISANTADIATLSGATHDHFNYTQSAGLISGGTITSGGTGVVDVSAGLAYFKATNDAIGETDPYTFTGDTAIALTDNVTNYIYLDLNSGVPTVNASTTKSRNGRTQFNLGSIFREGDSVHILQGGLDVTEVVKRVQQNLVEVYGIQHASGAVVSETGTLNIAISAGVFYSGLNRLTTGALDTSGTDEFEYYYNDGAWQETDASAINSAQYNDYGTGLATIAANRYGIHWVYVTNDGELLVVYGVDSYTLNEAQNEQPPANLPAHVSDFSALAAKIIVYKDATVFTEIESAWSTAFQTSAASNHNDLAGIQGGTADEYYHLTSAEAALVPDISGNTADIATNTAAITGKTSTSDFVGSGDTTVTVSGQTVIIHSESAGGSESLSGLTDTTISSPADYDVLQWTTGDTWQNQAAVDIFTDVSDGEYLIRDSESIAGVSGVPTSPAVITGRTGTTTIDAGYSGKIIEASGTFTITFPDSMDAGMRVDVVNTGTGTITLAASTTLQSKASATDLETQYGGASIYHRGSDVWLAVGDLT